MAKDFIICHTDSDITHAAAANNVLTFSNCCFFGPSLFALARATSKMKEGFTSYIFSLHLPCRIIRPQPYLFNHNTHQII